jgi:iron complex transport system ATP-binding protein
VLVDGAELHRYPAAEQARRIGLIPQIHVPAFAYTVYEMVLMGRAPHLGLLGTPSATDRVIVEQSLESVGLLELSNRPYTEISGGERQLILIARGLAQKCDILLMDEPSAHLDLSNQHRVLEIIDQLARQGVSFIISSHAPNNALSYASRVLLLHEGRVMAFGTPAETLTEPLLSTVYGMPTEIIYERESGEAVPRAILPRRPIMLSPESLTIPGSPLARIFEDGERSAQRLLITGLSGGGKSTWCARLAGHARKQGFSVRGVLSPAVFEDGRKVAIDMIDLATGERRRLANLRNKTPARLMTTQWQFDPDAIAWGNDVLSAAATGDLVIVDELGPLEFVRHEGLMEGLRLIDEGRYRVACVAVRPSLLQEAQQRWPSAQIVIPLSERKSAWTPENNVKNRSESTDKEMS